MKLRLITIVLLALSLSAQVHRPPVYFGGPLGPGGPFPLFNSGTIVMPADANYTMVYPDMSAHVLRVSSSTTLTATRDVIAPHMLGFEFIVQNVTTGNQSIRIIGASGTGVTIPNGQAMLVINDGTNFVSVGSSVSAGGNTSPFVIRSIDGLNTLTINVPNSGGGDPNFVSSTGTIDIGHLLVSDLAGSGTSCLQADPSGNVGRAGPPCGSGGGGMVWPATAGVANYAGSSAWGPSFNASNQMSSGWITPTFPFHTAFGNGSVVDANPPWFGGGPFPSIMSIGENTSGALAAQYTSSLNIQSQYTNTSTTGEAVISDIFSAPNIAAASSTGFGELFGVDEEANDSSNSNNGNNIYGIYSVPGSSGSGNKGQQGAVVATIYPIGSGTTNTAFGISAGVSGGTSSSNPVPGPLGSGYNVWANGVFRGTVGNLFGFYSTLSGISPGAVTNYYANYVSRPVLTNGGTITNLYSFVSEPNAGNFGINTITPAASLDVVGTGLIRAHSSLGNGVAIDTSPSWPNSVNGGSPSPLFTIPSTLIVSESVSPPFNANVPYANGILVMPNYVSTGSTDGTQGYAQSIWSDASIDSSSTQPMSAWGIVANVDDYSNAATKSQIDVGVNGYVFKWGSENLGTQTGIDVGAQQSGTGTIDVQNGVNVILYDFANTGTITNQYGVSLADNVSGTITNSYGIRQGISLSGTGARVTNYYGQYLAAPSVGTGGVLTNKYSFVSEPNAGNFGINTITPQNALDVTGDIHASTNIIAGVQMIAPAFNINKSPPPRAGEPKAQAPAIHILGTNGAILDIDVPDTGDPTITSSTGNVVISGGGGGGGGPVPFSNITAGTNTGQGLRVGTGSNLSPDLTGGVVIANILGGSGVSGGVATGNAYPLPSTFVPGAYLQFTGSGLAWTTPTGGGGGSTSWSDLTAPTQDLSLQLGRWRTVFQPNFAGDTTGGTSFAFQQTGTPGTGTQYYILSSTATAANVSPLNITNSAGNGFRMDSASQGNNMRATGAAKFVGPVQLTGLNSAASLATDATGNIIAGTGGGGGGGINPLYTIKPISGPSYDVTAADFASCVTLTYSGGGAITVNMATITPFPPPAGQCLRILNYSTSNLTISNYGNVNGIASAPSTTVSGNTASAQFANGIMYISNGTTGYISERSSGNQWSELQAGNLTTRALTVGNGASLNPTGTGTIGATTVPLSGITAATSSPSPINNGNFRQTWNWNFGAGGSGVYGLILSELAPGTGTPGNGGTYGTLLDLDTRPNSTTTPLAVYTGNNGFFEFDYLGHLKASGGAKYFGPIILGTVANPPVPVANAPALGTDANGNIIPVAGGGGGGVTPAYSQVFQGASMQGNVGPLALPAKPECSITTPFTCTAVTPTADTDYRLMFKITQTAPGAGCTTTGSIQLWITYTDPDSNFTTTNANLVMFTISSGSLITSMNMGNAANGIANTWTSMPFSPRVKAGTSLSYRVQQTVAAGGCSPDPVFTLRVAMFAGD